MIQSSPYRKTMTIATAHIMSSVASGFTCDGQALRRHDAGLGQVTAQYL